MFSIKQATVDEVLNDLSKVMQRLDKVRQERELAEKHQLEVARQAREAAELARLEADRAWRVYGKINDLLA